MKTGMKTDSCHTHSQLLCVDVLCCAAGVWPPWSSSQRLCQGSTRYRTVTVLWR